MMSVDLMQIVIADPEGSLIRFSLICTTAFTVIRLVIIEAIRSINEVRKTKRELQQRQERRNRG
jgi:hypothetical protein